jgi:hypothetical protein
MSRFLRVIEEKIMNIKVGNLILATLLLWGSLFFACGESELECGPGTVAQNGSCLPVIDECLAGTVLQDGKCVAACGPREYFNGVECTSIPQPNCALGTTYIADTYKCEPSCGVDQFWDGSACGDIPEPECASGTVYNPATVECEAACSLDQYWDGEQCLALPEVGCAPGTVLDETSGECLSACIQEEYWDGQACQPFPEPNCASGTQLNQASGKCELICTLEQYWDGTECQQLPDPECGAGTVFNPETGKCDLTAEACAPGTVLQDGQCVPEITECSPGSHQENGECVLDVLPQADVVESSEPEQVAAFDLPTSGQVILLGGVVDTPFDQDGDGYDDFDIDRFSFVGQAGTYLKISAMSDGLTMPAFLLRSEQKDDEGYSVYVRYALCIDKLNCAREIYLPRTDNYTILVSDFHNLGPAVFGNMFPPVGGDDFDYVVAVENLGEPQITEIDSLPLDDAGDFTEGLKFFRINNAQLQDVYSVISCGDPSLLEASDAVSALLVFDTEGNLHSEAESEYLGSEAIVSFSIQQVSSYLIVQDYVGVFGNRSPYTLDIVQETVIDCTDGLDPECGPGSLAAGESKVLLYNLLKGDLLVFRGSVPGTAQENFGIRMLDQGFNTLSDGSAGYDWLRWDKHYSVQDGWIYLWFFGWFGGAVPEYDFESIIAPTPLLEAGVPASNLSVVDMPEDTLPDSGVDHFIAEAGKMAVFVDFMTHNPIRDWITPLEEVYSFNDAGNYWTVMGPALDISQEGSPAITPTLAYVSISGSYLHVVSDPDIDSDILGVTYDTTLQLQDVVSLGTPASGIPVGAVDQSLALSTGLAIFSFTGQVDQSVNVSLTPLDAGTLQAEVMLLSFGWMSLYDDMWRWSDSGQRLGLKDSLTADGPGSVVELQTMSPISGLNIIVVRDVTANQDAGFFDLTVSITE